MLEGNCFRKCVIALHVLERVLLLRGSFNRVFDGKLVQKVASVLLVSNKECAVIVVTGAEYSALPALVTNKDKSLD